MKVLIVDDEVATRDTLRDALEDEGYTVLVAGDGREALTQLARMDAVCAVVLDLVMPEMSGEELLGAMAAEARLAAIPVVVVTSDPARAPAGRPVHRKPFRLEAVIDSVDRLCRPCPPGQP